MKKIDPIALEARLDPWLTEWDRQAHLGGAGVCVMQSGEVLYKKYYGKTAFDSRSDAAPNDTTIFRWASMTKPITAVAVLIQVSRGLLDLDEPIERLLPDFAEMQIGKFEENGAIVADRPARHKLTPRILLNHTNGLGTIEVGEAQFATMTVEERQDIAHVVERAGRSLLSYEPTERESYSSIWAFDVLARLVELTSGMDFASFLKANIFDPCGMTDATFVPTEEQWSRMITLHDREEIDGIGRNVEHPMPPRSVFFKVFPFPTTWFAGGAGLAGTLPDYVRFAEMLRRGGVTADGVRILPEHLVREMGSVQVAEHLAQGTAAWGLGVLVTTERHPWEPAGCYGWQGAYGTYYRVDPANDLTFVLMRNSCHDGGACSGIAATLEYQVYEH